MMSNQSRRQADVRAYTGTAYNYEGDFHAMFDLAGIPAGDFNGRMLAWVNQQLGTSYTDINSALNAYAVSRGVASWNELAQIIPGPTLSAIFTNLNAYTTPSWLSFSRAGNAMHFDSTGSLTWAPSNMLLNSASLSTQTLTVTNGATNILSFSGTGSITYSGAATGTLNGTGAGNRVSVVLTMTSASLTLTVSGTVTNAQFERVTYQTSPRTYIPTTSAAVYLPRYNFDPTTSPATALGLLIEPSRANLAIYSEKFDNAAWFKIASSITTDNIASPSGLVDADKLIEDTSTGQHYLQQNITFPAISSYTFSVFAKAAERNWIRLFAFQSGLSGASAFFNISAGTIGTVGAGCTAAIVSVGNGWYRCSITYTASTATACSHYVYLTNADGNVSYTGNGTSGVHIWGVQLEAGSFATSYIQTIVSSITRPDELMQLTGSALTVAGANTGTAIVETQRLQSASSAIDLLSSSTSRRLLFTNSSNTVLSSTDGTTRLDATIGGSGTFTGGSVRSGVSWTALRRALVANNGTVTTDSVNLGTGATVTLGGNGTTTTFSGVIASIALYNTALPDAVLKTKSTVGAVY